MLLNFLKYIIILKKGVSFMNVESRKNFLINILFAAVVFLLVYYSCKFLTVFLFPFLIGLIVSVISQHPVDAISKKTHIKRNYVSVFFVVCVYFLVLAIICGIGYGLYSTAEWLLNNYETYVNPVKDFVSDINLKLADFLKIESFNMFDHINVKELVTKASEALTGYITPIVSSVPTFIISVIVTVVASCYIAGYYTKILGGIRSIVPKSWINKFLNVKNLFFNNIFKILRGYIIVMFITFCELCLGFALFGVDNFVSIAALVAIVDIFPVLGVGTVLIPWALILLITGSPVRAILMALLYVVITVVRNFIEPRIIGNQMGLHPLITLICMFVGLRLFGIIGMFCVPLAAMIVITMQKNGMIDILAYIKKNFFQNE